MKISKHKRVLGTMAAGLALSAAFVSPAQAAQTTATFTLAAAGGLSISAPGTASAASSGTAGANTVTIDFGSPVQVVDNQGSLAATWIATVTATDFVTTEGGTAPETLSQRTITKDRAGYTFGTVTTGGGLVTATPVESPAAVFGVTNPTLTGVGVGNNSASWTPSVAISVPATAVVGTYTGTITHSVA